MFLAALAAYLLTGIGFAIPFAGFGVKRIDRHAARGTWGFRLLLIPGAAFLWPLLAKRWLSGAQKSPEEKTAHRSAARL